MRQEPKTMIVLGMLVIPIAALAIEFDAASSGIVAGLVAAFSIGLGIAEQIFGGE